MVQLVAHNLHPTVTRRLLNSLHFSLEEIRIAGWGSRQLRVSSWTCVRPNSRQNEFLVRDLRSSLLPREGRKKVGSNPLPDTYYGMPGSGIAQPTESDALIWLFIAALHEGPEDHYWTASSETHHNNPSYHSQLQVLRILHKRKEKGKNLPDENMASSVRSTNLAKATRPVSAFPLIFHFFICSAWCIASFPLGSVTTRRWQILLALKHAV